MWKKFKLSDASADYHFNVNYATYWRSADLVSDTFIKNQWSVSVATAQKYNNEKVASLDLGIANTFDVQPSTMNFLINISQRTHAHRFKSIFSLVNAYLNDNRPDTDLTEKRENMHKTRINCIFSCADDSASARVWEQIEMDKIGHNGGDNVIILFVVRLYILFFMCSMSLFRSLARLVFLPLTFNRGNTLLFDIYRISIYS